MKRCEVCGKRFHPYKRTGKYCSDECRKDAARRVKSVWSKSVGSLRRPRAARKEKACARCGTRFIGLEAQLYCSDGCRESAKREYKRKWDAKHWREKYRATYVPKPTTTRACKNPGCLAEFKTNKGEKYCPKCRRRKNIRAIRQRTRYATDATYRLGKVLRGRIAAALKGKAKKSHSTVELLGCSIDEARRRIESMFLPGMTWENHGAWHIDHIRPCASFDLTDPMQQRECFDISNIQPLWAEDNLRKGTTI